MFAEAILCVYANCRYELPKIIEELKALDADIIALQEVDIACKRSNNVDTGEPVTQVNLRSCRHNWTGATLGNSGHYIVQMRERRRTSLVGCYARDLALNGSPCHLCRRSNCSGARHGLHLPLRV